jgi:hypothetical protein
VQTYLYFNKVSSCVHIVDIECSEQAILLHNLKLVKNIARGEILVCRNNASSAS